MIDDTTPAKTEAAKPASDSAAKSDSAPANYSRGEGQKPVTQVYKDNWNLIFGKKETPARPESSGKKRRKRNGAMVKEKPPKKTVKARRAR